MKKIFLPFLFLLAFSLAAGTASRAADNGEPVLQNLRPGSLRGGFRAIAVYRNDADRPMGARFRHEKTGFTLDYLRIQTAPQCFIWVNTPPTSDKGEPHTQEHLLLGKGNRGRYVASEESLSLAGSSAFTEQWRTCYDMYTAAGSDVFFQLLRSHLDALLHPDYTDEEIRREVRNWGVTRNPDNTTYRLEEKGTVYNEMVSSLDRPGDRVWHATLTALYGPGHPLSFVSGGTPEALRTLTPTDIRVFHDRQYRLGNMGMIVALPRDMALGATLTRMSALLDSLHSAPVAVQRVTSHGDGTVPAFPAPRPAPLGSVFAVPYPDKNEQQPGSVWFVWPAERRALDPKNELLLNLFLDTVAGEPDTDLYRRFIDSKTRVRDTGAQGVFGWVDSNPGFPVFIGLSDVSPAHRSEAEMKAIRADIRQQLIRIAGYKDGSPELLAFNRRMRGRLLAEQRGLSKFVNSPPGFGFRNSGSGWMDHLLLLERAGGFQRSVTMKPQLKEIDVLLSDRRNPWRAYLSAWKLLDTTPFIVTPRANPTLAARQADARQVRAAAETGRLEKAFGVQDAQEAIRRYQANYDRATAALDAASKGTPPLRFLANPPLTMDDRLDYKVSRLRGAVPLVASTFDDMTGATIGLALRFDETPADTRFLLPALPALLAESGVIENGRPLSYPDVLEKQRREILSVYASFSSNPATRRVELLVEGAGNDPAESKNAVAWMRRLLVHPDWRPENLPRLRDIVDQALAGTRNRMKGSEESWVNAVGGAYWRQDDPLLLTTGCFLTQTHALHRLRWRFMDAAPDDRAAAGAFLKGLAGTGARGRTALTNEADRLRSDVAVAAVTTPGARRIVREAGKDLALTMPDLPDDSLAADWAYLCREMAADLTVGPEATLKEMDVLRRGLLQTGNARTFVIGSRAVQNAIALPLSGLLTDLTVTRVGPPRSVPPDAPPLIARRLQEREPEAAHPLFVGLIAPNMQSGVFLNSAKGTSWRDTDTESLLRYLSMQLYGGGGADGIFMKTWSAGLAYSNGIGSNLGSGRVTYYAERTPELPQTLRFVIDTLKNAPHNARLSEYALASAFGGGRAASAYESRGQAMAADLADGETPAVVKAFHSALLAVRTRPDLTDALYERLLPETGKVLPGSGPNPAEVPGAIYFVIGPEKQFAAYESYLRSAVNPETRVWRLYPRDFWLPLDTAQR